MSATASVYQAEDGVVFGDKTAILVESNPTAELNDGYSGEGYVDFGKDAGDYVEWVISAELDGDFRFDIDFANGGGGARPLTLSIDGVVVATLSMDPTYDWRDWETESVTAALTKGEHTVRLTAVGNAGPNIDALRVTPEAAAATVYQAEDGTVFGEKTKLVLESDVDANLKRGYTGEGYVDFGKDAGDYVEWVIDIPQDGPAQLDFAYANGGGSARPINLIIDGVVVQTLDMAPTANWRDWATETVTTQLTAGAHTVRVEMIGTSGPNLDALTVTPLIDLPYILQAEDGALTGAAIVDDAEAGAVDGHYVDLVADEGDAVALDMEAAEDGVYALTFRYALTGTETAELALGFDGGPTQVVAFDPVGPTLSDWGEVTVLTTLAAGAHVLSLETTGDGGLNLDQIAVELVPASTGSLSDIRVEAIGPGPFDDLLSFNTYWEEEDSRFEQHDVDWVRIHNDGSESLEVSDLLLTGPFELADPAQATAFSVAAGASVDIAIKAIAAIEPTDDEYVATGALTVISDDADEQAASIDLASFIAPVANKNYGEPEVADLLDVLGLYNEIVRNDLRDADYAAVELTAQEVLVRSWTAADPETDVTVTQLARFSGSGNIGMFYHDAGDIDATTRLWVTETNDQRALFPTNSQQDLPIKSFDGEEPFSFRVRSYSSDPYLNTTETVEYEGETYQGGMAFRTYEAYDLDQNRIENAYVIVYDGLNGNADYNDAVLFVENVTPFEFI